MSSQEPQAGSHVRRTLRGANSAALLVCFSLLLALAGGCGDGADDKIKIADPNATPAPQAGGAPGGYEEKEVVIE